jgi:hypothetical protein
MTVKVDFIIIIIIVAIQANFKNNFLFFVQKLQFGSISIKIKAFVDYRKNIKNKKRG